MPAAVGASLVVTAMQSFAGLAGHLTNERINWWVAAMVAAAAVVGDLIGGRLTGMVDPDVLRKLFGWFVLWMASVILAQETTPSVGVAAAGLTAIAAGGVFHLPPNRPLSAAPARRPDTSGGGGLRTCPGREAYPHG